MAKAGDLVGRYTLKKQIDEGHGGNGTVWSAEADGIDVAVKLLKSTKNTKRRARFTHEIEFLSSEPGEGVLPLIDKCVEADTVRWYSMPIAMPLRNALDVDRSPERILDIVASYAETLARLAERGISHRDIKPDNLFLLRDKPVIGDFGLVTYPGKQSLTEEGEKLGPAHYHAPEMLSDADSADGRPADVWSLAKTLWALLAGQPYPQPGEYRSGPPFGLKEWLVYTRVPELDELIMRCTRMEPESRLSMTAFAEELRAILLPPPEIREDADVAELQDRLIALTRLSLDRQQQGAQENAQRERAALSIAELHSTLLGHLNTTLTLLFREQPGAPASAARLFAPQVMPKWSTSEQALLLSPDGGRARIIFSIVARILYGVEQVEFAALLEVIQNHKGLEDTKFLWSATPGGGTFDSALFARALAEIEAGVRNSTEDWLRAATTILSQDENVAPIWYRKARPAEFIDGHG